MATNEHPIPHAARPCIRAGLRLCVLAGALGALTATGAAAGGQMLEPSAGQQEILESGQAEGVRLGSFALMPTISAAAVADSNVYNVDTNRRSDIYLDLRPSVVLQSDFSRHSARITANADIRRYGKLTSENTETFGISGDGRLDFANDLTLNTSVGYDRRVERRGTFGDDLLTPEPVSYNEVHSSVSLRKRFNRVATSFGGSVVQGRYLDTEINGVKVDESYRDFRKTSVFGRGDFAISPRTALFVRGSYSDLTYRFNSDDRGAKGYTVLGGVSFAASELFEAEAGLGYIRQNFREPGLASSGGLDYYVKASWYPRRRIAVSAAAERSIERSPLQNVSSVLESTFSLRGSYAATSRVLLGAEIDYIDDNYQGIDRREHRISGAVSARYLINRRLSVVTAAGYRKQTYSGVFGRAYNGASVQLGLRLAM